MALALDACAANHTLVCATDQAHVTCPPGHPDAVRSSSVRLVAELDLQGRVRKVQRALSAAVPLSHLLQPLDRFAQRLHLSLNYFACHTRDEVARMRAAISDVRWSGFEVRVDGPGCMIHGDALILYLGVDRASAAALDRLTRAVEASMRAHGVVIYKPRTAPFHISVAHVAEDADVGGLMARMRAADRGSTTTLAIAHIFFEDEVYPADDAALVLLATQWLWGLAFMLVAALALAWCALMARKWRETRCVCGVRVAGGFGMLAVGSVALPAAVFVNHEAAVAPADRWIWHGAPDPLLTSAVLPCHHRAERSRFRCARRCLRGRGRTPSRGRCGCCADTLPARGPWSAGSSPTTRCLPITHPPSPTPPHPTKAPRCRVAWPVAPRSWASPSARRSPRGSGLVTWRWARSGA